MTNDRTMENTFTMRKKRKTYSDTPTLARRLLHAYSYTTIRDTVALSLVGNFCGASDFKQETGAQGGQISVSEYETLLHQMFRVEEPVLVV